MVKLFQRVSGKLILSETAYSKTIPGKGNICSQNSLSKQKTFFPEKANLFSRKVQSKIQRFPAWWGTPIHLCIRVLGHYLYLTGLRTAIEVRT